MIPAPPMAVMRGLAEQRMQKIFSGLLNFDHSKDQNKRNMKSVLEAVTEVIRGHHGSQSTTSEAIKPTAYFSALMTVIESGDIAHMHILVHLLSIVMPAVSVAVLRTKSEAIESVLNGLWLLAQHSLTAADKNDSRAMSKAGTLTRTCLQAQSTYLIAQDTSISTWNRPSLLKVFTALLTSVVSHRPKLRRIAHEGIKKILEIHASSSASIVPKLMTTFCAESIQKCSLENSKPFLRLLTLLRQTLGLLPPTTAARTAAQILRIPQGNLRLSIECIRTVSSLFADTRCALSSNDLAILGNIVLDLKPSGADVESAVTYAQILCDAQTRFHSVSKKINADMFPRTMIALTDLFESPHKRVRVAAGVCLSKIITECIDLAFLSPLFLQYGTSSKPLPQQRSIALIQSLLGMKYTNAHSIIVPILKQFFIGLQDETFDTSKGFIIKMIGPFVTLLADKHFQELTENLANEGEQSHEKNKKGNSMVEQALGASLSLLGAEAFLAILPFQDSNTKELRGVMQHRLWILDFFKAYLGRAGGSTSLVFFQKHILNIARQCEHLARNPSLNEKEKQHHRDTSMRLWYLFPSFCQRANDVSEVFTSLGPMLGGAIKDERYPELTVAVCHGLCTLVRNALDDASDESKRAETEVLAKYSKNFLPLFFNAYDQAHGLWEVKTSNAMGDNDVPIKTKVSIPSSGIGKGGASDRVVTVASAISAYASITPASLLGNIFDQLLQKLMRANGEETKDEITDTLQRSRRATVLTGISASLVPFVSPKHASLLFRVLQCSLSDDSKPLLQKRSYACLEAICQRTEIQPDMLKQLSVVLQDSLVTCTATAKKHRLRCLTFLVGCGSLRLHLRVHVPLLTRLLGELLLCTKDSNLKVRDAAFDLLSQIACGLRSESNNSADNVSPKEFVQMAMAALGGKTPHMRSAALLGLTRLMYEFKDELFKEMGIQLLDIALLLMREKAKEVVKSALGYLKMCISVMEKESLLEKLESIMAGLMIWAGESKNRFKQKIRLVLERLVRKLGVDEIRPFVPERDMKLLTHIIRTNEKNRRKKIDDRIERRKQKRVQAAGDGLPKLYGPGGVKNIDDKNDQGNDMMEDDDDFDVLMSEDESSDEWLDQMEESRNPSKTQGKKKKRRRDNSSDAQWLRKDGESATDLLSMRQVSKNMRNSNPNRSGKRGFTGSSDDDEDEITEGVDGRIVIKRREMMKSHPQRRRGRFGEGDFDSDDEAIGHVSSAGKIQKRGFGGDYNKTLKRHHKSLSKKSDRHSASAYRGGKSGGDTKRKGKLDPYAYIPLDVKYLGKKHKKESLARFSEVTIEGKKNRAKFAQQPRRKKQRKR